MNLTATFNSAKHIFAYLQPSTRNGSINRPTPVEKTVRNASYNSKINMRNSLFLFIFTFTSSGVLSFINTGAIAQSAPSAFTIINQTPPKKGISVNGYGETIDYPVKNVYNLKFGSRNADSAGVNRIITGFAANGFQYKPILRPVAAPYDAVVFNRKGNTNESDLGKFTGFFENNGSVTSVLDNNGIRTTVPNNTNLYYLPEYVNTMSGLINSYIVNRGTDNLFANSDGHTINNIERVDLILSSGVTASDAAKTGFLLMERGGNDPFGVAAITGLTPDGKVASLGPLVKGAVPAWGTIGTKITSTVFQKKTTDIEIRPNESVTSQSIAGTYISLQALQIPANTATYGIAVFPGDVTGKMDLLGLTNVPDSTSAVTSQLGGLDMMSGGGFFAEQNTELLFSLSGNVYDDGNGLTDNKINGIGTGSAGSVQLYAYLSGSDNKVTAKVNVNPDGSYLFKNKLLGNTTYTVIISAADAAIGDMAPATAALPIGWVTTGDSYGTNNQSGSEIQTGIPDLSIPVKVLNVSITNVNFGIEQLPFPGVGEITLPNPGGTNSTDVTNGTFTNIKSGADADGTITSIVIFYPASGANSLTVGTTTYSSSDFATAFPSGAVIQTDSLGNPLQTIKTDPANNGAATVVINYIAIDNQGRQSLTKGSATIHFTRVNQVPLAANDQNTTNKNIPVSGSVISNDTASGDGGNTWSIVSGPTNGTAVVNNDGSYTYTPNNNYSGIDVFTYKLCDADNDCANATVTIRINDIPAAKDDANTTSVNTPVSGTAAGNDTPSADGGNTWTLVSGPANGTVVFKNDGSYTYTPNNSYSGTDAFTYKLCDADNDCANAKVTIKINAVPVAKDDANTTNVNTPVSGTVTGNDTPSADGGNTWTLVSSPTNGTVAFKNDGSYTYTPNNNYSGTDVFTYKLCDADSDCATAKVTIKVNAVPVAKDDASTTSVNTPVSGSVTGNDTPSTDGGNTWTLVSSPANGTVVLKSDGSYTYTPNNNYSGTDVFTYKVCDADNDCATAKVTIKVNAVPVAKDDANTTNVNTSVSGSVTGNDTPSADGGNTWTLVSSPTNGTVVFKNDGSYTYTPNNNYSGTDVFTYKVCDADNDCATAKVTIQIVAPVSICGCNPSPDNLITNGSFENGMTGWNVSGGNFYTGSQYTVCGSRNAYLLRTCGTARIWQDATGIIAGQTLTLRAWSGTHTAGIKSNPALTLRFIDKYGYQISYKSIAVDKNVDVPDYKLKEYTITAIVPSGAVKVRVEGSIDYDWLKLDAVCLTVTGSPAKGSVGDIVWNDMNGNGIQDANEGGLSGVKVTLVNSDNTSVSVTTNANGAYSFTNLLPGTYSVLFTTPSSTTPSPADMGADSTADSDPVNGKVSGIVINGQNRTDIDAGFYVKSCINTPIVHSRNYNFISSSYRGRATSLWLRVNIELKKGSLPNNGDYVLFSLGGISLKNIACSPSVDNTPVPNGKIVADNSVAEPVTAYDAATNSWLTRVPVGYYSSEIFISGAVINSSTGFEAYYGRYSELSGTFSSNKASFTSNWTYGLSCYQSIFTYAKICGSNSVQPLTTRNYRCGTPTPVQNCTVYGGSDDSYYSCSGGSSDGFTACYVNNTKPVASRSIAPAVIQVSEVKELTVKVSPNPSVADFKINIKGSSSEKVTVRITDLFGRDFQKLQNVQPNTTLSTGNNLKPGNYILEVTQGTERKIVQLMKM